MSWLSILAAVLALGAAQGFTPTRKTNMAQLQSLAYAPGTLREYETIYILKPDTIGDTVADVNKRVRGIIEESGGKILKVDNWGKRRMAYEIKKERKGVYLYWQYLGSPEIVTEFERNLRMLDPVIRYMTIRLDENVDGAARPSDVDEEAFERAAVTAADEEDEMLAAASDADAEEGAAAEGDNKAEGAAAEGDGKAAAAEGDSKAAATDSKDAKDSDSKDSAKSEEE